MRRTLAGLALIIAVAAAGVWAVASLAPPTSAPQREPALVVPVVGSPTPEVTAAPAGPTPPVTATPSPSSPVSTSATPSGAEGSNRRLRLLVGTLAVAAGVAASVRSAEAQLLRRSRRRR